MTAERRELMMEAAESVNGFETLRELVCKLVNECIPVDAILDDLGQIVDIVEPEHAEDVEGVRDHLAGYCHPPFRIIPPKHCQEQTQSSRPE